MSRLIIQRMIVCLRLASVLLLLIMKGILSPLDLFCIRKKGSGLSATFIVGKKFVVKIKNEKASSLNRRLYNGRFDGLFFYDDDRNRFQNEFMFCELLAMHGLTAQPILLLKNALVMHYIPSESIIENQLHDFLPGIFNVMDRVHALNVFHGDFNLGNFLIQGEKIFLIDFESSRFVDDGNRDDLYALDTIIFIEKLHRFHKETFFKVAGNIRTELEKREGRYDLVAGFGRKYLPEDVYHAIFG
jgi:hypothetical protein